MSEEQGMWKSGEVLAYTEREGPGRPPAASSAWLTGALIGIVGVTFTGVLLSDGLCPDHRAWVQGLATIGLISMVGAVIGLVRGWAIAPVLTLFASSLGVAIGLLDAVHAATRGRLIALAFAVAFALAAAAAFRARNLHLWDAKVRRSGLIEDASIPASSPIAGDAVSARGDASVADTPDKAAIPIEQ